MSVLTKVLVVLVAVISVILVALIVPFVANQENWKSKYEAMTTAKSQADAAARIAQMAATDALQSRKADLANASKRTEDLESRIVSLTNQLAKAQSDSQIEAARSGRLEAQLASLAAANQENTQVAKAQGEELSKRREEMVKLQTSVIELSNQLNDSRTERDTALRQIRYYQEQMAELQQRAAAPQDATASATPVSDKIIPGQITAVEQRGGDTFVQVNVGKADGVAEGMEFLVHRGNRYVGRLVISAVGNRESAGRMKLSQGGIAIGDAVQSSSGI